MLRPLIVDLLLLALPLLFGAALFLMGKSIRRVPMVIRIFLVAIALTVVAGGIASYARLIPPQMAEVISFLGGQTVFLGWAALFMLGVGWSDPGRDSSNLFLSILAGLAGLLVAVESFGPLYWRYLDKEPWTFKPDMQGRLVQSSGMTCSATAAAMLLARYGIPASEGEMAYLSGTSLFGADGPGMARALRRMAATKGMSARSRKIDYAECEARGKPFVAHLFGPYRGHAVLVERVFPEGVIFINPSDGEPEELGKGEFIQWWDGTAVEITP